MKLLYAIIISAFLIVANGLHAVLPGGCDANFDQCNPESPSRSSDDSAPVCGNGCTNKDTFTSQSFTDPVSGPRTSCGSNAFLCSAFPERYQTVACFITVTTAFIEEKRNIECQGPPDEDCSECVGGEDYSTYRDGPQRANNEEV